MSNARLGTSEAFALTSDPAAYVPSAERERALEQMTAALEADAIPCLEGPTGIGKTLLLQLLAQRLSNRFEPVYLPYPMLSTAELCQLALGLLERSYSGDPEAALLQLVSERAAQRRPLLLLIDDAGLLPPDSARGLAALRAQSRNELHLAFAGIGGGPLLDAMAPFGDTLLRVALDEGISEAGLRDYVAAQLDHAGVSAKLRAAFDDDVLDALAREASGNPRRLHLAAQTILRRAEGRPPSGSPPAALVETAPPPLPIAATPPPLRVEPIPPPPPIAATPPPPRIEPTPPPAPVEAIPLPASVEATPPSAPTPPPVEPPPVIRPEPAPPIRRAEPAQPSPVPRSEPPAAPAPAARAEEPIGEYRIVRRRLSAEPPSPAPTPPPLRPVAAPPARHEIETPGREIESPRRETVIQREPAPIAPRRSEPVVAPEPEPSEPNAPLPRPPWEPSTPARRPKKPAPRPRTTERTPSFPLVVGVAIASALLGFAVASHLQRTTGRAEAPARPAPSVPATEPGPTPSARVEEPPPSPPPAPPEASAPEPQAAENPAPPPASAAAPTTPAPAPPEPERAAAAPKASTPPAQPIEVSINATPWAVIEVDGRELGETPLGGIALERGTHHFVARFPNGRVVERKVEIDASHRALVFE